MGEIIKSRTYPEVDRKTRQKVLTDTYRMFFLREKPDGTEEVVLHPIKYLNSEERILPDDLVMAEDRFSSQPVRVQRGLWYRLVSDNGVIKEYEAINKTRGEDCIWEDVPDEEYSAWRADAYQDMEDPYKGERRRKLPDSKELEIMLLKQRIAALENQQAPTLTFTETKR